MTPNNQKPEWFQLTEGDRVQPRRTIKRGFRVFAVTLPLLVLGTGFVVAQTQGGPGASADATTSLASAAQSTAPTTQSVPSPQSNSTASVSTENSKAVVVNASEVTSASRPKAIISSQATIPTTTPTSTSTPPSIKFPTGGGNDDGFEGSKISGATTPNVGTAPSISQLPSGGGEVNDD